MSMSDTYTSPYINTTRLHSDNIASKMFLFFHISTQRAQLIQKHYCDDVPVTLLYGWCWWASIKLFSCPGCVVFCGNEHLGCEQILGGYMALRRGSTKACFLCASVVVYIYRAKVLKSNVVVIADRLYAPVVRVGWMLKRTLMNTVYRL